MRKIFVVLLFLTHVLNAIELNFEQRQNLIFNIKQTIVNEELISESIQNYIKTNYKLPTFSNLGLTINPLDTNYFNDYSIDTTNENLIINYNLKTDIDDASLISLYESNTFRDRTFYYLSNNVKTIRVILNDEIARHLYGLIKFNGGDITDCTTSAKDICLVIDTNSIRINNSSGTFLYEYKIENYKSGPMTVTSNTTLHTSSEFDFVPNGVSLIDENGIMYVKTDDGIKALQ